MVGLSLKMFYLPKAHKNESERSGRGGACVGRGLAQPSCGLSREMTKHQGPLLGNFQKTLISRKDSPQHFV